MKESEKKDLLEFGKSLRKWRLDQNIGMRDFAIQLNISASLLSRIEAAFPPKPKLENCFVCKHNHD